MTIRIRRATSRADMEAIRRLDRTCFPEDAPVDLTRNRSAWWIATSGREVVGYSGGYSRSRGVLGSFAIERQGVRPKARGQGLQRRMIRVAEAYARREGLAHVVTYTRPDNIPSANNFIRCGYLLTRDHTGRGAPDGPWLRWRKPL